MRALIPLLTGAALLAAPVVLAQDQSPPQPDALAQQSDILFLGEAHDNPAHHAVQAQWVAALKPRAIVFEMLTQEQAGKVTATNRTDAVKLEAAFGWEAAGWPDFDMYFPIFAAAPEATILGAGVPREKLRNLMEDDLEAVAGADLSQKFGLDLALDPGEQEARETLQREAHCNALPEDLMPRMVSVQRLRDAVLADQALEALAIHGAPVVVITGNGHARSDWGAPALVKGAAPSVSVFALGQAEEGQAPLGAFDSVTDAPGVDRGDPCAAFK